MKRHRPDPVSFIWGLFFSGFGLALLMDSIEPSRAGLRAFWPLAGVALGLAILSSIRSQPEAEAKGQPDPPAE
ncbi:MAG: hypothetical protein ACRDJ4_14420 [Actinomycetota bacterium]